MNETSIDNINMQSDELGLLLEQATKDESVRGEFYDKLVDSNIFVLTNDELATQHIHEIIGRADSARTLDLIHWQLSDGQYVVPFFSSIDKLTQAVKKHSILEVDGSSTQDKIKFISLPTHILFDFTLGQSLFLNPNCEYSKLFYPDEIKGLMDPQSQLKKMSIVTEGQIPLKLTTLETEPELLVNKANELLKQQKIVTKAYLARFASESLNESGYLLGIEMSPLTTEHEYETLFMQLGESLSDYLDEDDILDICVVRSEPDTCQVSHFLKSHTRAFYQRRLGGFLRDAIKIQQI
ncbi:enhanced serine sensitivity protein SseB C-terminal domain-containing protein [Thorsellia anophelis]|uniref:SseB protein N-terminal domain-containing protein n=1 Tax=Thorsellia anophelis DSM 18579 TaxID=1123402 RepID=A0A1I0A7T7_9GAMM|nr:enhanced serine sensitivity protein SseB C-terminal domain-containing protein [Thorsellia anophelis]SES89744.1 SseB protein N-terminal domain-containing protein [Thorsellia anophelis DSM 18579]